MDGWIDGRMDNWMGVILDVERSRSPFLASGYSLTLLPLSETAQMVTIGTAGK
jgi:hypothetical protein